MMMMKMNSLIQILMDIFIRLRKSWGIRFSNLYEYSVDFLKPSL